MNMEVFRPIPFAASTSLSSYSSLRLGHADAADCSAPPVEREHMFHKVVTPSDVGKLNRLVIPKHYAEKYFPLDPSSADKGIHLSFEDPNGKHWEFRYSYWNSSQSYVMTKGWSRFVKDKQLDSGDTVSFSRATAGESGHGRFFIDWHRPEPTWRRPALPVLQFSPWGKLFSPTMPAVHGAADLGRPQLFHRAMPQPPQQTRVQVGGGMAGTPLVLESVPVRRRMAEPRRVRLFGVDLECSEMDSHGETSMGTAGPA
ncbi:unnamed protein product [Musa hybrid cultivar]